MGGWVIRRVVDMAGGFGGGQLSGELQWLCSMGSLRGIGLKRWKIYGVEGRWGDESRDL